MYVFCSFMHRLTDVHIQSSIGMCNWFNFVLCFTLLLYTLVLTVYTLALKLMHMSFLRATAYMLIAHMLSQFRLSVTRVDQSKTAEVRIMQFSPYNAIFTIQ